MMIFLRFYSIIRLIKTAKHNAACLKFLRAAIMLGKIVVFQLASNMIYIPTDEVWLYTAILKDLCLKKIVGYAFSSRIDTNLTVSALEMAVNRQKPPGNLIFHSDRGVQYASVGYREALAKHNITQSMSGKGDPLLFYKNI